MKNLRVGPLVRATGSSEVAIWTEWSHRCEVGFPEFFGEKKLEDYLICSSEVVGRKLVERRMTTLSIVKTFNIFKDLLPGLRSTFEGTPFNTFALERAEEALHSRVIIAVPPA